MSLCALPESLPLSLCPISQSNHHRSTPSSAALRKRLRLSLSTPHPGATAIRSTPDSVSDSTSTTRRAHVHGLRYGRATADRSLARQRALGVEQVRVDYLQAVHGHLVVVRDRLHVVCHRVPVVLPGSHLPRGEKHARPTTGNVNVFSQNKQGIG